MKPIVIAIDGPSGAGKGTVSRTVSHVLGFRHVDTGAMYRAVGWKALQEGVALDDEAAVAAVAERAELIAALRQTCSFAEALLEVVGVRAAKRALRTNDGDGSLALLEDVHQRFHAEVAARRAFAASCTWDHRLGAMLDTVASGRQRVAEKRALLGAPA